MNVELPAIEALGENALLLTWPDIICPTQHQQIIYCQQLLNHKLSNLIVDSVASYASLALYYDCRKIDFNNFIVQVEALLAASLNDKDKPLALIRNSKNIEIPVYYGEQAGWDINAVSQQLKITPAQIIQHHSSQKYRAYALGFTPGFCYLASLVPQLQLPRKITPRQQVPVGAVAIAEQQTAIYPSASPGGWHIIGQTPVAMLHHNHPSSSPLTPTINIGDTVTFKAINKQTFISLGGRLQLEGKV